MHSFQWLGQAASASAVNSVAWEAYVRALRGNLNAAWMRALNARNSLKNIRERLGLPFISAGGEGAPPGGWDEGLEQNFREISSMVATLSRFADEALAGGRRLVSSNGTLGFERLPADFTRVDVVVQNGLERPVEVENATDRPVVVTGTVGALPPIVIGAIAIAAAITTYFVVEQVCETVENVAEQKTFETLSNNQTRQIEQGATPEQAKALTDSLYEGAAQVHEARAMEAAAGRSEIPQTIRTVGFIALGLAALYIVAQLFTRRGGGTALAPARMLDNPVRRSGDVRVNIKFRDAEDDYAGTVTWPGGRWRFDGLRLSPFMRSRIAADSSQAYDEAARAAISFGADANEEILGHADFDDRGEVVVRRR
jgi:hypothetical protein